MSDQRLDTDETEDLFNHLRAEIEARVASELPDTGDYECRAFVTYGDGGMILDDAQVRAKRAAAKALESDLRFEHLSDREIDELVWDFIGASRFRPSDAVFSEFFEKHREEPRETRCHLPVMDLNIPSPLSIDDVELSPVGRAEPSLPVDEDFECVAIVPVRGTNQKKMRDRARVRANRALARLRIGIAGERISVAEQRAFHLGRYYWFDDGGGGKHAWQRSPIKLEIDEDAFQRIAENPLLAVELHPGVAVHRQVELAVAWLERADRTSDPAVAMLFRFFALEALFTRRGETGQLSQKLIVRRAVLSEECGTSARDASAAHRLYKIVRSAAVHGESVASIDEQRRRMFAADVRKALVQYLEFVVTRGLQNRGDVITLLDRSAKVGPVLSALRRIDPTVRWSFDPVEGI